MMKLVLAPTKLINAQGQTVMTAPAGTVMQGMSPKVIKAIQAKV